MSRGSLLVAVPARTSRDWRGRGAWGRDGHLTRALAHCLGPASEVVLIERTAVGRPARRRRLALNGMGATSLSHQVEIPGWTRRRLPAAVARRMARRVPAGVPDAPSGLVVCFDLLRYEAAERLARERGWPLVTDLMDDWRAHSSMPAWHGHLASAVFPRLPGPGGVLSSVTNLAADPGRALLVPNAGHHEGDRFPQPAAGPTRPVAAFVGTIHPRIDAGLLLATARELPGWDVVAAGPVMDRALAARLSRSGVRVEPWWSMDDIDRHATVVICPYVPSRFTWSGDPLKVYEATARGVPCVSTVSVSVPPAAGLSVVDSAGFVEAVHQARLADRSEIVRAARATGSWEDRARLILGAVDDIEPVADPLYA